jgi:2,4-dienoyl-CoA reductase (NADPH2)
VVVVGGDLAAIELSEFLAERGRVVSVLEAGAAIAPEVGLKRRSEHMDRLDRLGVTLNTGARVVAIEPGAVQLDGAAPVPADSVVLAGVVEPNPSLYDALRERVPAAYAIGDCTGLGLIRQAIEDAARVASLL